MRLSTYARILFITGTDTGVGKTVVTALMLSHLRRRRGLDALAAKPFCSGGRDDALLLSRLQDSQCPLDVVNPYSYAAPLAPMVAARLEKKPVRTREVASHLRSMAHTCEMLLVEGAGGLLAPLCEKGTVLDLMRELRSKAAVVVAANRLGTINHTLLTVRALRAAGVKDLRVALVDTRQPDESCATNHAVLREQLGRLPLAQIPWLGKGPLTVKRLRAAAAKLSGELDLLCGRG